MSLTHKATFDAFDPGVGYCARARFVDGVLVDCRMITGLYGVRDLPVINHAIVERVVTRGANSKDKYKAQDLLDLAWSGGTICGQYETCTRQSPHTVPKKIWQGRVVNALNGNEVVLLPKIQGERYHVLDAIGVGLKYLGRI